MKILEKPMSVSEIKETASTYYKNFVKAVADIDKNILAIDAEYHSDLETLLLKYGCKQESLYGFDIQFQSRKLEFYSMINYPRNREAGYLREGTYIAEASVRDKIEEMVEEWIIKD